MPRKNPQNSSFPLTLMKKAVVLLRAPFSSSQNYCHSTKKWIPIDSPLRANLSKFLDSKTFPCFYF